jgi:hypothetical protein
MQRRAVYHALIILFRRELPGASRASGFAVSPGDMFVNQEEERITDAICETAPPEAPVCRGMVASEIGEWAMDHGNRAMRTA